MLSKIKRVKQSKLSFDVSGNKAKVMLVVGVLSATAPALAKNLDSTSPKAKDAITTTIPDQDDPNSDILEWLEAATPAQAQEWMTHTAPADALNVEKVNDLTDIIPTGAPEVFDDERTEPWKREIMRNHILKGENGGNWSFFSAKIEGVKKLFALTASHVIGNIPVGTETFIGGDLFGFQTQGGEVFFKGVVRAHIGPGDPNSTDNKFSVQEITRYWGISGGELDAGPNDYKTLRTFPLAVDPIDTTDPGYIGEFTQSGRPGPTFPNYDPALEGRWVAPVNLDPTGDQDQRTGMGVGKNGESFVSVASIPIEVFHEDSTNVGFGSSGGEIGQVIDPNLTPADMRNKNADNLLTKDIVEDYRILGPLQNMAVPDSNGVVLDPGLTLVQPYRSEIEQAIGGILLDIAWDLEISGTGDTREVGKVVDIITSVDIENGPTLP